MDGNFGWNDHGRSFWVGRSIMAGRSWNHKNHYIRTVDLFILARYRDRTVSDRSLSSTVHGLTSVTVHRSPFFQIFLKYFFW